MGRRILPAKADNVMRHMLSKFRGAFWSMKMKKKLCLIFAFTSISILLLNFVLYSHIDR